MRSKGCRNGVPQHLSNMLAAFLSKSQFVSFREIRLEDENANTEQTVLLQPQSHTSVEVCSALFC